MDSSLSIGVLATAPEIEQVLQTNLESKPHSVYFSPSQEAFISWAQKKRQQCDCLILQSDLALGGILEQLQQQGVILPVLLIMPGNTLQATSTQNGSEDEDTLAFESQQYCDRVLASYHQALRCLSIADLGQIEHHIHQAIDQFLQLPSHQEENGSQMPESDQTQSQMLSLQQQRLTEKLQERLGYLGVYYKRSSENFLRNMSQADQEGLLRQLKADYRAIVLKYFSPDSTLNQKIDDFVNAAFFADISVSHIVEIHMDLMEEFSKQLKLEGRNEEILLDYRLTLIDVIAHLCEMYRRSIPREP